MATIKKGQLTASGEWAQHLRPILKRLFWKKEWAQAKRHATKEATNA